MGFFSWKCAVSGNSLASRYAGKPKWMSECYLVTPTKTIYEPSYEGYGVFGGKDVYEILKDGLDRDVAIGMYYSDKAPFRIKVVLADYYKGQTYDELIESPDCPHQGFFF